MNDRRASVIARWLVIFISMSGLCECRNKTTLADQLFNLPMARDSPEKEARVSLETHSLLQPVGDTKSPRTGQNCEGACISPRACDYHGGTSKGHCITGNVCCKFERSCRGVSYEKISFFQSPNYPNYLNGSLECSHAVHFTEDVCAIRVDFLDMRSQKPIKYPRTEKCVIDSLYVLNTLNGPNEALCEMENYSLQRLTIEFQLDEVDCGRQLMYEPNDNDPAGELNVEVSYDPLLPESPLIVNGKNAEGREFPWQVSLQITPNHRCGGTILNEDFVVTAAHCVMGKAYESLEKIKVVVGDLILNTTEDGQHEEHSVESVIVNFHYKTFQSYINDIAVIKVKTKIKYSPSVQPICLPPKEGFVTENREAVIAGWGRRNGTSPNSPEAKAYRLQKLTVRVLPDDECREAVRQELSILLKKNITANDTQKYAQLGFQKSQLCAMAKLNSTVCFGDSGGGLVMQDEEDGRYFQVGVVSYGLGQCVVERITPVAYTRITEYLDFISMATAD